MPRRTRALPALLLAVLWTSTTLLAGASTRAASAVDTNADYYAAAVRDLRRAVTPQRDASNLPRLLGLRQLADPTLHPVLKNVARSEEWQMQVHGVLGLAEIDGHGIDPWLLTEVHELAREAIVANAIDMDLIEPMQIGDLLEIESLNPVSRLLLIAELVLVGEPVDRELLARLAASPQLRAAGLASMLIAQLGEPAAFSAWDHRIKDLPSRDRNRQILWILEAIRQFELTAVADWVTSLLARPDIDRDVHYWCVYTLLVIDTPRGVTAWRAALGADPAYRDRVRFALLLLASESVVPATTFDLLAPRDGATEPLIGRMIQVGRARAGAADPVAALIALIDLGHLRTANWALTSVETLPDPQAAAVYRHVINLAADDGVGRAERGARAVRATARLFAIDPDAVLTLLERAQDDGPVQEVILLGLFETSSPAAGIAASRLRRIGAGPADSLALLLMARHADARALDPADIERLGRMAAGGGRVSTGLQAQAAWLYLKHTATIERALAEVFENGGS